ncbi:ATP-binding protein [Mesorhizobium japonicum]|uniref:ATP-binding protein n=1 Tax=Mesorhizobium TaxID=68287 RepID=UPI0007FE0636|nr:hypothetical protein A9K71_21095 [Mesorhizobium sp. WSM3873]
MLANLIDNSARHGATLVSITAAMDGQAIVLVSDEGAGISPSNRTRIFEPSSLHAAISAAPACLPRHHAGPPESA